MSHIYSIWLVFVDWSGPPNQDKLTFKKNLVFICGSWLSPVLRTISLHMEKLDFFVMYTVCSNWLDSYVCKRRKTWERKSMAVAAVCQDVKKRGCLCIFASKAWLKLKLTSINQYFRHMHRICSRKEMRWSAAALNLIFLSLVRIYYILCHKDLTVFLLLSRPATKVDYFFT